MILFIPINRPANLEFTFLAVGQEFGICGGYNSPFSFEPVWPLHAKSAIVFLQEYEEARSMALIVCLIETVFTQGGSY